MTHEAMVQHILDTRATARACFAQINGVRVWVRAQSGAVAVEKWIR